MTTRNFALAFTALALAAASFAASAGIQFSNLGTAAPPASVGGYVMTPFDQSAQAMVPDSYANTVTVIPGSPIPGTLSITPVYKATTPSSWGTWSHGYGGAVYYNPGNQTTLTLPANTHAFYFYVEPDSGVFNLTAIADSGTSSGPIPVNGSFGATGYAFYSTAGEAITSITITTQEGYSAFAVGEFGINGQSTTCASEGYKGAQLTWCKNICENGLSGQVLDTWIHRWTNRYRDLPYCAVEGAESPQNPPSDS